ncbi:hypothetical protein P7K49_028865 [Saguinus oedipus]|uniref:IGFBP N-terminal domain-containing protein n=1 Tax=Saguinus oedipus TaxID=9490 RepID=A0ABQ9U5K6_SAGOE|nr:hypothetical protein P7K49_028865 [Saguinus oedipus]
MYLVAGGRGLAGCGHLPASLLGLLLLLLARSGTRALVCLPCDESKCEEPRNCPGSIVQGVCGCCYTCASQRNESCGGTFGIYGTCDRGLRCVIRPPLNGDSLTEYEAGVCEGTAARCGPPPTWPAPPPRRWLRGTKFGRDFPEERGLCGRRGGRRPRERAPAALRFPLPAPPTLRQPRTRLRRVGGGGRVEDSPLSPRRRAHVWPFRQGLGGLVLRPEVGAPRAGGGHCGGCRARAPRGARPCRPPRTGAVWHGELHTGRESPFLWAEETCRGLLCWLLHRALCAAVSRLTEGERDEISGVFLVGEPVLVRVGLNPASVPRP